MTTTNASSNGQGRAENRISLERAVPAVVFMMSYQLFVLVTVLSIPDAIVVLTFE